MPFNGDYPDSAGKSKPEQSDNWRSIGEVSRKVVEFLPIAESLIDYDDDFGPLDEVQK